MDLSFLDEIGGPRVVVGIAGVLLVLWVLSRILRRKPQNAHLETTRCPGCGWVGQVSKLRPVCPKCARKL